MRLPARSVATLGAIGLGLANVGRIPSGALGGRNAPLVLADLVVALVWFVLFVALLNRRVAVVIDDVTSAVALFVGVCVVSTTLAVFRYHLSMTESVGAFGFLVRWIAYFGWYLFVAWCLTPGESRLAWRDIERVLLAFAVFGLLQSAFLPGFAQMIHAGGDLPTWDIQGRRLVSTVLDPNFAGILIVVALIFRLGRVAEGIPESVPAMLMFTAAVLLTVSRSALLALGVGILVIAGIRGLRMRLFRVLVVGVVLVLPFLSLLISFAAGFHKLSYDASAAQRLIPWSRAVKLLIEHPWFGVGFNAIRQAQESHGWPLIGGADVSLDGGLLFVAAMTGVLGLLVYVLLLSRVWQGARRAWRDPDLAPDDRAHATATAAATAAVVVHSFFVNSLLLPFVMQVLWVMWARLAHIRAGRRARQVNSLAERAIPRSRLLPQDDGIPGAIPRSRLLPQDDSIPGAIPRSRLLPQDDSIPGAIPRSRLLPQDDSTLLRPLRMTSLAVVLAATACDPCAGTLTCSTAPRVTLTGTIVDHSTGAAVPGAHIDARFTGPNGFSGVASAISNSAGLWQLTVPAPDAPQLTAQVTVTSPGRTPYTVSGLAVHTSRNAGDATALGLWSNVPFTRHLGTIVHGSTPLSGALVHFAPTSGVALTLGQTDAATNGAGIFELDFAGDQVGTIIGVLTVTHPSLSHPSVLAGYTIPLDYHFDVPAPHTTVPVGAILAYGGQVVFRGTGEEAPGVGVEFTRTGGIAVTPDHFTTTTGAGGFFLINLSPQTDGEVTGDLTLHPPTGSAVTFKSVRFATYDSIAFRSAGLFAYGERWAWAVELWRNDSIKPAPGVGAAFVRTGGVATTPDTILGLTTGSDGRFELRAAVRDTGFVDGNIVVFPKTGPPRLITGIHLHTNPDDQLHFAGVFSFGPGLHYVGEVLTTDGAPVVGAQVNWTQTSGIPATPPTLDGVTDASGRFPLTLYPSADGGVIGRVTVRPPPPWAPGTQFVFDNLRLDSFEVPELRLAVTYRIPRP